VREAGSDGGRGRQAVVALGSNLAQPAAQLRRAAVAIAALAQSARWSSLYLTTPVGGPAGQPDYLNAVAVLRPLPALAEPRALLDALLAVEREQGRRRAERWGPRTLDLDLLDVDGRILEEPGLVLPHPRMMSRGFVLGPLCEVLPGWRHPLTGESACAALARVGAAGVHRTRLDWRPR